RVEPFCIFAHDDQINIRIAPGDMRHGANGPEVGEKFETLTKFDIDAGKPSANRRRNRTFQADAGALDRFVEIFRDVLLVFFKSFGTGCEPFPFEFDAGSFENADDSVRYFRADAVAGDEGYFVRLSHG